MPVNLPLRHPARSMSCITLSVPQIASIVAHVLPTTPMLLLIHSLVGADASCPRAVTYFPKVQEYCLGSLNKIWRAAGAGVAPTGYAVPG